MTTSTMLFGGSFRNTGFGKALGQKSDVVSLSGDLRGYWDPSDSDSYPGSGTTYNNLSLSNPDLRIFNGITYDSSTPSHFKCDGVDDYIGPSTWGYGMADPFYVDMSKPFTVGLWYRLPITSTSTIICSLQTEDWGWPRVVTQGLAFYISSKRQLLRLDEVGQFMIGNQDDVCVDTWHFGAITYDNEYYRIWHNGTLDGESKARSYSAHNLYIGRAKISEGQTYAKADTKFGHIYIWDKALTNAQLRQTFLASHRIHKTGGRIYGDGYDA